MDKKADNENLRIRRTLILSLLTTVLFVCVISVYYRMLYYETRENIVKNGRVNAVESSDQINRCISAGTDILKLSAHTVDSMIKDGRTREEILAYLTTETVAVEDSLIAETTGIYGYILGVYMDGSGWVPDEGYDPVTRPWYKDAMTGAGELMIVDPYIDVDTGKRMISLAKLLGDGESVVSIDVSMSEMQEMIEDHVRKDRSYAEFIISSKNELIAHSNKLLIGKNLNGHVDDLNDAISEKIRTSSDNYFYLDHDNRDYMVYVMPLDNGWTCVSVIDASSDFHRLKRSLATTIFMAALIGGVLTFFIIRSERVGRQAREATIRTELAMAASEAKTSFISSMSHEIRTPINAIIGMNEMIQREEKDETILQYSDTIKNAGTTLLAIINDVLDLSKIEAGKIEIIPVDYDLISMITDLVSLIKGQAEAKGLRLEVNIDSDMPHLLHGDEIRIRQIITNILTNAVKYTEKGSVTIDVGSEAIPQESGAVMLKVAVTDTGIGIREENIEKLFAKFDRIDEEKNRNIEGTGLGMSITKSLLNLMGSEIEVKSVYGEGSTFSFSVRQGVRSPERVGDTGYLSGKEVKRSGGYKGTFTAPSARVLTVDDSRMNLSVFEKLIKHTMITTDKAESGEKAVQLAKDIAYDVLFIDHLMPGMNGMETLKRIRTDEGGKNASTPAVCLTANADSDLRKVYIGAGFDDYLTKPIVPSQLENMLLTYIPAEKIGPPGDGSSEDKERIRSLLKKMKDAAHRLDCDRMEAVFDELKAASLADEDAKLYKALEQAVSQYEYDEVEELIKSCLI